LPYGNKKHDHSANNFNLVTCLLMDKDVLAQLGERIANDDQLAYRQLFIQFYTKLSRFVMGFTKNKELTDEIVSDVFINIWRRRKKMEEVKNLKLYLYVSAKNITFNYLKKLHRQNLTDLDTVQIELEDPFADPGAAMITREMNLKLKAAINDLPPRCKLIFTLVKEDGLSYKQTAELLSISESTVENQISIALKKISGAVRYTFRHN
jgi:RNA polymerase sigma-70 factor (family 1)